MCRNRLKIIGVNKKVNMCCEMWITFIMGKMVSYPQINYFILNLYKDIHRKLYTYSQVKHSFLWINKN